MSNERPATDGHLGVGGRLKEGPADELVQSAFAHEVGDGPWLYRGMSLADLAHVVMLCEIGAIPPEARATLLKGLLTLHDIPADQFPYNPIYGDIYTNREQKLRELIPTGGADGWLRAGRARRESSTVGYLIATRSALLEMASALADLLEVLARQADHHLSSLMPDYTYLQKAHPTTLAHYLMTFAGPMQRDSERLRLAFNHVNRSPAGGGSVNGSRLPLDRARVAALIGFDGPVMHTRDAMWSPDVPLEVLSAAVAVLTNVDRLAEDLYIFATEEFGYVQLADAHSRTSVIMPQKKNPYSLAFVRGAARTLTSSLITVVSTNQTPSGQPDNRIFAYGVVPRALQDSTRALKLMSGALDRAVFNTDLMAKRAAEGFSGATDLGDYLSDAHQLDPRQAHQIIGLAIRQMRETGDSSLTVTAPALERAAQQILGHALNLSGPAVAEAQHAAAIVGTRTGIGGASQESTRDLVDLAVAGAADLRRWLKYQGAKIATAERTLMAEAQRIASGA